MFDDRTPIYRQIADEIRDQLLTGALAAGDQVMSTTQYSTFHRINPATVAKAFQQLVDEGLLEKRRGIGMFVTEGASERLRAERRAAFVGDVVGPMMAEAQRLGIPTDDVLEAIRAVAPTATTTNATTRAMTPGDHQ
ncbi:MAG TPA: GntR family transcriptional regulator [Ilumatobacteraceae bacterium]|nr:GntR family transcriptional regulator [Ilumatobacteraceae bacterium]